MTSEDIICSHLRGSSTDPLSSEIPRSQMVLEETPREANRKMELDVINLIEECSRDLELGDVSELPMKCEVILFASSKHTTYLTETDGAAEGEEGPPQGAIADETPGH